MSENVNEELNEEVTKQAACDSEETTENVESINSSAEKKDDFKERFFYVAAELENTRKRFEREKENLLKYGNEKVLSSLLSVVDNFDLTVASLESDKDEKVQNIVKGIDMIRSQFLDTLSKNGLTLVESVGKEFDPNFHEAVAQMPNAEMKNHMIMTEYQRGYILNGRLLRAAKVVVVNND